ncbi:hypothetical protein LY78DRAFT_664302 [Colletotrichum sublineola]|nr:hypothetical protein LY78DRAFT_664302 [Colletotrichum sublineola]
MAGWLASHPTALLQPGNGPRITIYSALAVLLCAVLLHVRCCHPALLSQFAEGFVSSVAQLVCSPVLFSLSLSLSLSLSFSTPVRRTQPHPRLQTLDRITNAYFLLYAFFLRHRLYPG